MVQLSRFRAEPQRLYKWRVRVDDLSLFAPEDIEGISLSYPNHQAEALYRGGSNLYLPSFADISAISIDFVENVNNSITEGIAAWKQLMQRDGLYSYPLTYKKDIFCDLLKNDNTLIKALKFGGCFPTTSTPSQLAYESSGKMIITQEFSVDNYELQQ